MAHFLKNSFFIGLLLLKLNVLSSRDLSFFLNPLILFVLTHLMAISECVIFTCFSQEILHHVTRGGKKNLFNLEIFHFDLFTFNLLELNFQLTSGSNKELFIERCRCWHANIIADSLHSLVDLLLKILMIVGNN